MLRLDREMCGEKEDGGGPRDEAQDLAGHDSVHWTPLDRSSTRAVSTWLAGVAREDATRVASD